MNSSLRSSVGLITNTGCSKPSFSNEGMIVMKTDISRKTNEENMKKSKLSRSRYFKEIRKRKKNENIKMRYIHKTIQEWLNVNCFEFQLKN
jgi:hypothetical protein